MVGGLVQQEDIGLVVQYLLQQQSFLLSSTKFFKVLPDKSDRAVASALGISPFFVKDYAAAAKRYSAGKTFAIIGYFRDTDARMKGINNPSAKDADLWKEFIYKIMH